MFKKFISGIADTFKGSDGKLSNRRLTAFLHIVLMAISTIVLWLTTSGDMVILYCILVHGVFALLLLGIITVQNIITWKQGYVNQSDEFKPRRREFSRGE